MKILVFGDSIAWGAFDIEMGGRVERLKTYFLAEYSETGLGIYNCSVSSNDSRGVLRVMSQDIEKITGIEPENLGIMIAIGTNDCRYITDDICIEFDEFSQNISTLLENALQYTPHVRMVGGFPIDEKLVNPWCGSEWYRNKDLYTYTCEMKRLSEKYNVPFIDIWNTISADDLSDGLHPNANGHYKIYEQVKKHLQDTNSTI